jgi:hypothetical protein
MRCLGIAAVMLLVVGSIYAKDDAKTAGLSKQEAKDGFVSLFDGRTLKGWQGNVKGYVVKNGTILFKSGENLFTTKEYANFIFRFEFKLPPGGNNGIGIRTPLKGIPTFNGMEIQILDDGDPQYKSLAAYQYHGSIYGVVPARRGALKPVGQWNQQEILANGSHIKVTLNGRVIVDADLSKIDKTMDGAQHPGLHNAKGYIALLGHEDPVAFRNLRIKTLP